MTYQIKRRYSGTVLFECELPADLASGIHARHALEKATAARANLEGANLEGANLGGANLGGANLRGADLGGANLGGANLEGANLRGANLRGAYLRGANLRGANLEEAYLRGADLRGANLRGANLEGADLGGADLRGAYREGANLERANLRGAKWADKVTISKIPIQLTGLRWPVTILDAHLQIGCQLHSLYDWVQFDDAAIAAMDGREALRFWRGHKEVLMGLARSAGRSFEAQGVVA